MSTKVASAAADFPSNRMQFKDGRSFGSGAGHDIAATALQAQLDGLNRTGFSRPIGTTTTSVPSRSAVIPRSAGHEMTSAQRTNARAEALGYVRGSDFAQQLGLQWTEFCTAVRTGVVPKPVITRDGNDYFDAKDVANAVARRKV